MITKEDYIRDKYDINDLLRIVEILRAPGGCPWDIEQTHKSIRGSLLEETYEAADAIDNGNDTDLCEELGDVLLQVTLHSQIASEENSFDFNSVTDGICKKLILRHPHVFGTVKADTTDKVLDNWDKIKRTEKKQKTYSETLESVPHAFPALMRAAKVQKRAGKAGFDWNCVEDAFEKIPEETEELKKAIRSGSEKAIDEEFGDLLFAAVNISRFLHIDPEFSLTKATEKFIKRFKAVEDTVISNGGNMTDMTLQELDKIWAEVKEKE